MRAKKKSPLQKLVERGVGQAIIAILHHQALLIKKRLKRWFSQSIHPRRKSTKK